jgi:endogenous inhibitor of DNA gyrase (YacG/DUF329 family)
VEVSVAGEAFESRRVKCPGCEGVSVYGPDNPYRPFCSERCKNHDLGAWASEQFRMEAETPSDGLPFGDPKLIN